MTDVRNRLSKAWFPDERVDGFERYQVILFQAYDLKEAGTLGDARRLLQQNTLLPKSLYQKARTEYILAEYYKERDRLRKRSNRTDRSHQPRQKSYFGKASEHFSLAAQAAKQVPDWALFAQLKAFESKVCYSDVPHQFLRAFAASRDALKAWRLLPDRDLTSDLRDGFVLAEELAVSAQFVAEDQVAVEALDWAAFLLHRLRECPDYDVAQYANDDLYLSWDWAYLYHTLGHFRQAFASALKTRRKGDDLLQPINRGRLQYLIASIANDCVEEGEVGGYSRNRLLNVAEAAILLAYELTQARGDTPGYALVLITDAKWLALKHNSKGRIAKIAEAEKIAIDSHDELLLGQVEIAWGDEFAFQNLARPSARKVRLAREWYQKAEQRLSALEAFNLARQARRRRSHLP